MVLQSTKDRSRIKKRLSMWRNEITAIEEKNKEMVAIFKMEKKRMGLEYSLKLCI